MIRRRYADLPGPPADRARTAHQIRQLVRAIAEIPARLHYWLADLNSNGHVLLHSRDAWRLRHVGWRRLIHRERVNSDIPATEADAASDWAADQIWHDR